MSENKQTHFGYQNVAESEKAKKVADVFHSVAGDYDLMNDLMSFGVHRLWKQFTIDNVNVRPGQKVLDIAGGTGDLAKAFAKKVGPEGEVILADINASMLEQGKDRLIDEGIAGNVQFVQANAECLPFQDNSFDRVTIAFGLRNVTHIDKALRSMYRVLKPGGSLSILEFSKPVLPGLKPIYDIYSFQVLPRLGEWIVGDKDSYQYLAESIRMFPSQANLIEKMQQAGFEDCHYNNLSGGIVALHKGYKY